MSIELTCAQCGCESEYEIATVGLDPNASIKSIIESCGWIVQLNCPHVDIYCSKECAA